MMGCKQYIIKVGNDYMSINKNKTTCNFVYCKFFSSIEEAKLIAFQNNGTIKMVDTFFGVEELKQVKTLKKEFQPVAKFWLERCSDISNISLDYLEYMMDNFFLDKSNEI